jgi:hypothetical protein
LFEAHFPLPSALASESDALASAVSARETSAAELRSSLLSIKPLSDLFVSEFGLAAQLRVLARACHYTNLPNTNTSIDRIREFVDLDGSSRGRSILRRARNSIRSGARLLLGELSEELQNRRQRLADRQSEASEAAAVDAPPDLALVRASAAKRGQVMRWLFESITTDFEIVHDRLAELPEAAGALWRLWGFFEARSGSAEAFVRRAESEFSVCSEQRSSNMSLSGGAVLLDHVNHSPCLPVYCCSIECFNISGA